MTTIVTKNGSGAPLASDLVQGELAVDLTNKRLYTEDSGGTVIEVGTNPSTIDINAGTIDGTVIGGSSAAAGTFTTFTSTGIDDNATSTKLTVSDSGIDVTGTVTSDGLTVDGDTLLKGSGTNTTPLKVFSDNSATNNTTTIEIGDFTGGGLYEIPRASLIGQRSGSTSGGILTFTTGESSAGTLTKRITIDSNGDISFYEDTGTSQAFFWDASAESLGIGTTSPAFDFEIYRSGAPSQLAITGGNASVSDLLMGDTDDNNIQRIRSDHSDNSLQFQVNNSERMRIDSSGNVGIGTDSPAYDLEVNKNAALSVVGIRSSDSGEARVQFGDQTSGNVGRIGYHNTDNSMSFRVNNAERMRIVANGDVGIGTTSPGAPLDVAGAIRCTTGFQMYDSGSIGRGIVVMSGDDPVFQTGTTAGTRSLLFKTENTERMRIDASGNLLVGTTSSPSGGAAGVQVYNNSNRGRVDIGKTATGNANAIANYHNGTYVGGVNYSDTVTSFPTSSDVRLKENIVDAPAGNIDDIRVRSFDWKSDGSHQTYGMVAQELVEVAPYATHYNEEEDQWGVDYSKLVPMMIKEIQDLKAEVAALKGE
jgi:hypothetical protein